VKEKKPKKEGKLPNSSI